MFTAYVRRQKDLEHLFLCIKWYVNLKIGQMATEALF